jgi:putative methanogenesis marker protein 8
LWDNDVGVNAVKNKLDKFLDEVRQKQGKLPGDLHVTRKAGALVAISKGKVIHVGKPTVKYCPLFKALFGSTDVDEDSIKEKFNMQFDKWGMFTCDRVVVEDKIIVPFGASEMMMYALKRNVIDCSVLVCEGAGTVITTNPALVQGIGAYMNGVFYTSPVKEIIGKIEKNNGLVLNIKTAIIDQLAGVKKAISTGHKNIAVTVRGDQDDVLKSIRELDKDGDVDITILSVCNTGISKKQAESIRKYSDIAWACASYNIWEIIGPISILQLGMKIPVFVLTEKGIRFISGYSKQAIQKLIDPGKKHYITMNKLESGEIKMDLGRFSVYLYETESLPLHASDEPEPLH